MGKKKNKGTTEYDKSIVACDVGTTQCKDDTIKYEKKIREPLNVTKVHSHMMLVLHNIKMVPSSVMFWQSSIVGCLLVGIVPSKKREGVVQLPTFRIVRKVY